MVRKHAAPEVSLPAPVKLTKREIKRGRETTRHCGQEAGSESQL